MRPVMAFFAQPPAAQRRQTCRTCGREIVFIRHAVSGRPIPCEPALVEGDGARSLIVRDEAGFGLVRPRVPEGAFGHVNHFTTCPGAAAHRRPRGGRRSAAAPAEPASPAIPRPPADGPVNPHPAQPDAQLALPL